MKQKLLNTSWLLILPPVLLVVMRSGDILSLRDAVFPGCSRNLPPYPPQSFRSPSRLSAILHTGNISSRLNSL